MNLYLAGADASGDHLVLSGLRNLALLVSYWYVMNGKGADVIQWATERDIPLFLDSGAFTAMTQNVKIDIDRYCDYCAEYRHLFRVIASLDVIGDYKATARNHDYMRNRSIESIPTFHVNAPFSELSRLCNENGYIALGVAGMQRRTKALMAWCTKAHRIAREREVWLHGFALTSPVVMRSFPWHSVDSSTWINARRFAKVIVKDGRGFIQVGRDGWDAHNAPHAVRVSRNATKRDYDPLLRHNAEMMLSFARGLGT